MKAFKLVGGAHCLDFTNTVGGRVGGEGKGGRGRAQAILRDRLEEYPVLVEWAKSSGLATNNEARNLLRLFQRNPRDADRVFERAVALREAIYRIFRAAISNKIPERADVKTLNEELSIAKAHERLDYHGNAFALNWDGNGKSLDCILWPVARSAADLLISDELARVRQCGGDECGWLFLDTSRNRSRQWCDMKDCGNLAKVRRFRAK